MAGEGLPADALYFHAQYRQAAPATPSTSEWKTNGDANRLLNPDGKKGLAPSTIFHTAASFLTNTNLQHYSGEVHLALGRSYPETGGKNRSALHWDLICDLRGGGRLTADGEVIEEDGRFAFSAGPRLMSDRRCNWKAANSCTTTWGFGGTGFTSRSSTSKLARGDTR